MKIRIAVAIAALVCVFGVFGVGAVKLAVRLPANQAGLAPVIVQQLEREAAN